MSNKFQSNKRGFTLIELLIYMVIFAIVLGISILLFFQSKTLEMQVVEEQVVDQNARAALLEMTQTVHGATSVTSPAVGASGTDVYLNNNAIHYFVSGGILRKTDSGQTYDITADKVTIQNLTFTTRGEVGKQPTVSINFTLKANTLVYGQPTYITRTYQTTMQLR